MRTHATMRLPVALAAILLTAAGCNVFGIGGGSSGPFGVLKTIDGGTTWHPSDNVEGQKNASISGVNVAEMAFDPNSSSTIYLGTVDSGLVVSTNSADTWKQLLSKVSVYDFYVDPKDSKTIYASGTYADHGRIVRTKDGGATWEEMYNEASVGNTVHTIAANPNNDQELYAALDSGTLIKSVDGGVHWFVAYDFQDVPLRLRFSKINNALYVLLQSKGLQTSTDLGNTWTNLVSSLAQPTPGAAQSQSAVTPKTPTVYQRMAIDEQSAGTILFTSDAGLFKSADNGKTWLYLNVPVKTTDQVPYAVASAKSGSIIYTSVQNTVLKSLDGGQSWQTQELPTDAIVSRIIVDPNNLQTVYAGLLPGQ